MTAPHAAHIADITARQLTRIEGKNRQRGFDDAKRFVEDGIWLSVQRKLLERWNHEHPDDKPRYLYTWLQNPDNGWSGNVSRAMLAAQTIDLFRRYFHIAPCYLTKVGVAKFQKLCPELKVHKGRIEALRSKWYRALDLRARIEARDPHHHSLPMVDFLVEQRAYRWHSRWLEGRQAAIRWLYAAEALSDDDLQIEMNRRSIAYQRENATGSPVGGHSGQYDNLLKGHPVNMATVWQCTTAKQVLDLFHLSDVKSGIIYVTADRPLLKD